MYYVHNQSQTVCQLSIAHAQSTWQGQLCGNHALSRTGGALVYGLGVG